MKKYFYGLRPALAIRALRLDSSRLPPMNLQALMNASDLPATIVSMINELVEAKSRTRELGNARRLPELNRLIADELGRAAELPARLPLPDDLASANRLFLELVNS